MEYKYIWAWGRLLGSYPYYMENEAEKAKRENAPETAIYRKDDGTWATFEDIKSDETKRSLLKILETMEGGANNG